MAVAKSKRATTKTTTTTSPAKRAPAKRAPAKRKPAARPRQDVDPIAYLHSLIRDIPDFPKPGILFKDITPLLADPKGFHIVLDRFAERFVGDRFDAILGIESRGFIFGAPLAARLNLPFIPIRKAGKLPYKTDKVSYALEYGKAELEMHKGSLKRGARVVIVDDLLATGGTAAATAQLVKKQGGKVAAYAFVVELDFLDGRKKLAGRDVEILSLLHY